MRFICYYLNERWYVAECNLCDIIEMRVGMCLNALYDIIEMIVVCLWALYDIIKVRVYVYLNPL